MHSGFGGFQRRLVGPHLPGEDDLLAILRSDRAAEVGVFAARNIVLTGFDDLDAAIFPEDRRAVLGPFAIGLHLVRRHGNHESCDVHGPGSLGGVAPSLVTLRLVPDRVPYSVSALGLW